MLGRQQPDAVEEAEKLCCPNSEENGGFDSEMAELQVVRRPGVWFAAPPCVVEGAASPSDSADFTSRNSAQSPNQEPHPRDRNLNA